METKDYSKEIYDKYFGATGKFLKITLKDDTILKGMLVSVFHGDRDSNDPYIIRWRFVDEKDMETYRKGSDMAIDSGIAIGRIIEQKDIKKVEFI